MSTEKEIRKASDKFYVALNRTLNVDDFRRPRQDSLDRKEIVRAT
jgi:hypothetical protein